MKDDFMRMRLPMKDDFMRMRLPMKDDFMRMRLPTMGLPASTCWPLNKFRGLKVHAKYL